MWLLMMIASAEGKPEGDLPAFDDMQPRVSCCVDRSIIREAIRERLGEIRACHTGTPGRGSLRWTVAPSSEIEDVSVETGDPERDACLAAVVETLSFPQIPCRLTVAYPLIFSAG